MTPDEVQAFVGRYIEYQQAHDAEALAKLYTQDTTVESPFVGTHKGRDAIEKGFRRWFAFVPGSRVRPGGHRHGGVRGVVSVSRLRGRIKVSFLVFPGRGNGWSFAPCSS